MHFVYYLMHKEDKIFVDPCPVLPKHYGKAVVRRYRACAIVVTRVSHGSSEYTEPVLTQFKKKTVPYRENAILNGPIEWAAPDAAFEEHC